MILLTGASGFVGHAVMLSLKGSHSVRVASRYENYAFPDNVEVKSAVLSPDQDWSDALKGTRVVIHCAARVHIMNDEASDPLREFRHVNVDGTLQLAKQAAALGVRRFIFISSIKVNGEYTLPGQPFRADQIPSPVDPYGISKHEAEIGLCELAKKSAMEITIIRPPLVYGPGVKANFLSMMKWLDRGLPLPLGGVTNNQRSLVALDNLVDLIKICIDHPLAANQTFLVSDDEDLSTAELLIRMGKLLGHPAKLINVPPQVLIFFAKLLGRPGFAQRLCGSLQVDICKTRELLNWVPPLTTDTALRRTAEHWLRLKAGQTG